MTMQIRDNVFHAPALNFSLSRSAKSGYSYFAQRFSVDN
jgi:hypothetical protein